MLKRWLSGKKKPKQESDSTQKSDGDNGDIINSNANQTPYHTPRMSPETKPIPKPMPIRIKGKNVRSSSNPSNQFQSPSGEKPLSVDTNSGNDTLPSLMSTSIETVMDMDSPILFTTSTEGMPYGDGSNKVFGFENFGNTCYCNSVLQCLYNMTEFRTQMLQYPKRSPHMRRRRKAEMPGKKPRVFNEASFDRRISNSNINNNGNVTTAKKNSEGSGTGNHNNSLTSESSQVTNISGNKNSENVSSNDNGIISGNSNNVRNGTRDSNTENTTSENDASISNGFDNSKNPNVESEKPPQSNGDQSSAKNDHPGEFSDGLMKESNPSNPSTAGSQSMRTTFASSNPFNEKLHENTQKVIVGRNNNISGQGPAEVHPTVAPNPIQKQSASDPEKNQIFNSCNSSSSAIHTSKRTQQQPQQQQLQQQNTHNSTLSVEQRKKSALIKGPVLNVDHLLHESGEANLYTGLKDIFESVTENSALTGIVSPIKFVDILKKENVLFNTTMHQDAHEFLNFLLNELSDYLDGDLKNVKVGEEDNFNFIKDFFQGTLTNRVKCFTCDNITSRDEPFLDFPIEVSDESETDIQSLLQNFDQREMLSGSNKFYCNECCGLQEAERRVGLKQLPHTLALHLKRFKYSETKNCNVKLFNKVHYPLTLEVCSTHSDPVSKKYELSGIVVHMGGGPQHGHYVSLCKNDNFGWLLFDDETVESISENTVANFMGDSTTLTTGYVLFYRELPFGFDNAANGIYDKKHYEKNIEKLLKYDEWVRSTSLKTSSMSETNPTEEAIAKEPPMTPPVIPNADRKSSATSAKMARPKSKLFNFMKS